MNPHELKQLESRHAKISARMKAERQERESLDIRIQSTLNELTRMEAALFAARAEPTVSEHALLRYAERVYGLDVAMLTAELLTPETKAMINTVGSGKIPLGDMMTLVVKNKTVVTVTPRE
jgi:Spy/CpxP family protein refolding chaperone